MIDGIGEFPHERRHGGTYVWLISSGVRLAMQTTLRLVRVWQTPALGKWNAGESCYREW